MTEPFSITVEGASKVYRIWKSPEARLWASLWGTVAQLLPSASRIHRYAAARSQACHHDFEALADVSFSVARGESVAIVGRNGSGKSTLLQIIAGTLRPTSGTVSVRGRVAALLELGAGFNTDFTGRENVYLNGSMLGLTRAEIDAKFDQIAAFADIDDFIDQPVRTYSTGMQMRLAFAVAAHVDADVLIVDEALSVGDARFQLKCAKTIDNLVAQGKTLLFVSHDFSAVKRLCKRAILLERGRLIMDDEPNPVVNHYTKLLAEADSPGRQAPPASPPSKPVGPARVPSPPSLSSPVSTDARLAEAQATIARLAAGNASVQKLEALAADGRPAGEHSSEFSYGGEIGRIETIELLDHAGAPSLAFLTGEPALVRFLVRAREEVFGSIYALTVKNLLGQDIYVTNTLYTGVETPPLAAGEAHLVSFQLQLNLMPGEYFLSCGWVFFVSEQLVVVHRRYDAVKFQVLPVDRRVGIANLHSRIVIAPHR